MAQQSEYYDPDTGMLHLWQSEGMIIPTGASDQVQLGLEDTSFNDVKFKLLSVVYKVKIFCDNLGTSGATAPDNNTYAFNNEERGAAGSIVCGIINKDAGTTFNDLGDFTGTSGWPVDMSSFATLVGNPASYTKTWKPRKLALSNEQNAFIAVRQDSSWPDSLTDQAVEGYASIYMRGIRL